MTDILSSSLDRGAAEAISLAVAIQADWLLIDERDGRKAARQIGLQLTGTLGILAKAKMTGRISSLQREIEMLRTKAHFFIRRDLENQLLTSVGESI